MDIRTDDVAENSYEPGHLPRGAAPDRRARPGGAGQAAAAVKPGGWLFVQEPDFHIAPTTEPDDWAETWRELIAWGHENGVDWLIGRSLPGMVSRLGLGRPEAKTDVAEHPRPGSGAHYFQLFFAEVRDRVLEGGRLDAATFDRASALLDDPGYWTQCWMMTAVWMRKSRPA
jgi:hypothetical protein